MKRVEPLKFRADSLSPPVRGRGLKQETQRARFTPEEVAPRAGAWIETVII